MLHPPPKPTGNPSTAWGLLGASRFALAWIVLSGHMLWFATPAWAKFFDDLSGKAAVIGFLLVSGFSIASSLERNESGFYRRRLLRIYPLYFFAILFAWWLEWVFHGVMLLPGRELHALGTTTAIGNLLLLQTFVVKPIQFDGPVWSLSIEMLFYLLAPWFARLDRRFLLGLIAISALSFAAPKHTDWGIAYLVFSKFNALSYLWCWLLGFLLWRNRSRLVLATVTLGIPLVLFAEATPERFAVVTYILSAALLLTAHKITVPNRITAIGNYLGDLSYPFYLFHLPSFILAYGLFGFMAPQSLVLVASAISITSFYVVDRWLKRSYFKPLLFSQFPIAVPQAD